MTDTTGQRAAIYARISSDRAGGGLGVARQVSDCRDLAATSGLEVVAVLEDNDLSASSGRKKRPGYRRLLDLIDAGEIDVVLAWHTDRLHRRPLELEAYISLCEKHGVVTRTVKAGELDLATPSGQLVARMLGAAARYEVDQMISRQIASHAQRARDGKWAGGMRPFGFEADGTTVRPDEAAALAGACKAVLEGVSIKAIARQWNQAGIKPPYADRWTSGNVGPMLRRPRYAGLRIRHGQVVGKADWPAIISEDLWKAVVMYLDSPDRRTNKTGPAPVYLGSGLFRCGVCGSVVTTGNGGPRNGPTTRRRVYRCPNGRPGDHHVGRTCDYVDDYISQLIIAYVAGLGVTSTPAVPAVDLSALHARLALLRERMDEAARMHAEGLIDGRQMLESTAASRASITDIERQISRAMAVHPAAPLLGHGDVAEVWESLDIGRKRAVVSNLMTVTILPGFRGRPPGHKPGTPQFDPDGIRIDWKE